MINLYSCGEDLRLSQEKHNTKLWLGFLDEKRYLGAVLIMIVNERHQKVALKCKMWWVGNIFHVTYEQSNITFIKVYPFSFCYWMMFFFLRTMNTFSNIHWVVILNSLIQGKNSILKAIGQEELVFWWWRKYGLPEFNIWKLNSGRTGLHIITRYRSTYSLGIREL